MNLRLCARRSTVTWTLLFVFILGLVSCDITSEEHYEEEIEDVTLLKSSSEKQSPRKYLELEDLNAYEAPVLTPTQYSESGEEYIPRKKVPKKVRISRSPRTEEKTNQEVKERNRLARQNVKKKQRPGFFWTLARVTYETFNDTRSAIQQIGQIINEGIPSEPPRKKKPIKKPSNLDVNKTASLTSNSTTPQPPSTTTEFTLSRPMFESLVRRNVKGLVRLFNIEWRDAIDQSAKNIQEFRNDLGKQLSLNLQDNPDNY